jgi:hypothetical protein
MARRCPPGVICIENITIIFVLLIVIAVIFFLYWTGNNPLTSITEKIIIKGPEQSGLYPRAAFGFSNAPNDVLLNPYEAPLRNDNIFLGGGDPRGIPINIPTQSVDASYRQVGILTRLQGGEMILPLMGRPLITNRDKWNFYTMSDRNNMVKLPVTNKGRSCTNEYGCDNLYNGDSVFVEGYNDAFKVTMYDNQIMRYIPYL